jgi:hypothetical protein
MTSKPMSGVPRKPVQIAVCEKNSEEGGSVTLVALCDDNTIWRCFSIRGNWYWLRFPPIPGDEP